MAHDARIEPLELDISLDLIELVDGASGGDLLDRVSALRRKLAMELGFVMPPVRTRDNAHCPSARTSSRRTASPSARASRPPDRVLVIGEHLDPLPGDDVKEPVFGLDARWTPVEFRVQAELAGHTVVDRSTLIVTHLSEIVRRRAGRLLSRTDVKELIDGVRATDPTVIDDLATANLGTGRRAARARHACSTTAFPYVTWCASSKPSANGRAPSAHRKLSSKPPAPSWARRSPPPSRPTAGSA